MYTREQIKDMLVKNDNLKRPHNVGYFCDKFNIDLYEVLELFGECIKENRFNYTKRIKDKVRVRRISDGEEFESINQLARILGCTSSNVSQALSKHRKCLGEYYEYIE